MTFMRAALCTARRGSAREAAPIECVTIGDDLLQHSSVDFPFSWRKRLDALHEVLASKNYAKAKATNSLRARKLLQQALSLSSKSLFLNK